LATIPLARLRHRGAEIRTRPAAGRHREARLARQAPPA